MHYVYILRSSRVLTNIFQLQNTLAIVLENQVEIYQKKLVNFLCNAKIFKANLEKKFDKIIEKLEKLEVNKEKPVDQDQEDIRESERLRKSSVTQSDVLDSIQVDDVDVMMMMRKVFRLKENQRRVSG